MIKVHIEWYMTVLKVTSVDSPTQSFLVQDNPDQWLSDNSIDRDFWNGDIVEISDEYLASFEPLDNDVVDFNFDDFDDLDDLDDVSLFDVYEPFNFQS